MPEQTARLSMFVDDREGMSDLTVTSLILVKE